MRIKKVSQAVGVVGNVANEYTEDSNAVYNAPYINDISTYSTTETVVGTWIDGKPLYRKVIVINSLPNATGVNYPHNISNRDIIYIKNAFWQEPSGTTGPIPMYITGQNTFAYVMENEIHIETQVNYSNRKGYVVLEYTKTTD